MIRIICIVFIFVLFSSCTTEAPKVRLSKEEKKHIDSVFSQRIPKIDTLMDSLCVVKRDKNYQLLKDSLIDIRMQEIEAIRNQ